MNLLKQVVLLLAHKLAPNSLLFALLKLVLERLSIDADSTIADDLVASATRYCTS